jgi:predicted RNase H-like HicB family nuclease/uncharacterized damage-inducible protein DinB
MNLKHPESRLSPFAGDPWLQRRSIYSVYLEIDKDGRCMAHVLDLPGCIARAVGREEALRKLRDAIYGYHAWLHSHGEPTLSLKGPTEVEVVEESAGPGPFDPGDAAALFSPDRKPFTRGEMEGYFRLMACSRADLLELVHNLPDEILDWKPGPDTFTIRHLLRHVGNAEEWYVSRLAPPETLPSEWEHDEALPVFEFLEMERRTAVDRLRRLDESELAELFYPTRWTQHPDEPWTARKALRRFLEHEREHTGQLWEILAGNLEDSGS